MGTWIYCVSFLIIGLHSVFGAPQEENLRPKGAETRYCAFYDGSQPTCDPDDPTCVPTVQREECQPSYSDKSIHCFQLWHHNSTNKSSTLRFKGCFLDTVSCKERSSPCWMHNSTVATLQLLTCCCEGDMCNVNDRPPGSLPPRPTGSPQETTKKIPAFDMTSNNTIVLESIDKFIHSQVQSYKLLVMP